MRMHDSQSLALQTYPGQVRGELSPDPPPSTPSFPHHYPACSEFMLFGHQTLCPYSSLPQTIAFPPTSSPFNTHSANRVEAV